MASHPDTVPRPSRLTWLLALGGALWLWALLAVSQAAVTSAITGDGTLGTTVTRSGTIHTITGGTRPDNGRNLFHSFDRFSVGTGDTARFSGPTGIANILSRVTGGQPSSIDGRLQSTMPGANLYLLNPSGVLFGPNASLEVSGSFHVSTADVLRFTDGATFSTHLGQASVLTVAEPAAFGFLGDNPAGITVQGGRLQVPAGRTLSVVGGDVTLRGPSSSSAPTLAAASGRINLVSVASPGDLMLSPLEPAPDLRVDGFAHLGRLEISQGARVNASGNGGGIVLLRSGRLQVDNSRITADNTGPLDGVGLGLDLRVAEEIVLTNGASLSTDSVRLSLAPERIGRARDLRLTAGGLQSDASFIRSAALTEGVGGNITVQVGTLTLTGGAEISGSTADVGPAGQLTIEAADRIVLTGRRSSGDPSTLASNTFGRGNAGRLFVSAPVLEMDAGLIEVVAYPQSSGNAGSIDLRVGSLTLTGGAQIRTTTAGTGYGGDMTVVATESISIAGRGRGGTGSGLFSATEGGGRGGNLRVAAPHLQLRDGGTVSARSSSGSDAGNLVIQTGRLLLSDNSVVTTEAERGDGGNIQLTAGSLVHLRDSQITATVASGVGQGGNITIDLPSVVLERSHIRANAFGGPGGSVQIRADVFLTSADRPESEITATSVLGLQGTVAIQAPVTMLSGALAPLPEDFVSAAVLLPARCAARLSGGRVSSLVLAGRDGLSLEPSGLLPSPFALEEWLAADPAVGREPSEKLPAPRGTLLDYTAKVLPRIRQGDLSVVAQPVWTWGCPK